MAHGHGLRGLAGRADVLTAALITLAERTYREAARLARDPRTLIVLPLGAVEQHGPHLPLLVDWLGAEQIARAIAPFLRKAGYRPVLAPALPYGASPLAARWPGTVSLTPSTLRRVIVEVVSALAGHGFRRFVLTNYQADPGQLAAIAAARRRLEQGRRLQVLVAGFVPGAGPSSPMVNPRVRRLMRSPRPDLEWHSGELETSLVLAVRPDLVKDSTLRGLPPVWVDFRTALANGARRFEQIAPGGRGYFGWPAAARATTGRRMLALRARLISHELVQALRSWRPASTSRRKTR